MKKSEFLIKLDIVVEHCKLGLCKADYRYRLGIELAKTLAKDVGILVGPEDNNKIVTTIELFLRPTEMSILLQMAVAQEAWEFYVQQMEVQMANERRGSLGHPQS